MKLYMGDVMRLTGCLSIIGPAVAFFTIHAFQKSHQAKRLHCLWLIALLIYVAVILHYTIFRSTRGEVQNINLHLFWSYTRWDDMAVRWQVYMNVFLFIPFGFFCCATLTAFNKGIIRSIAFSVFITLLFSCTIEIVQFIFALGLCEMDDVFHNTFGGVIGSLLYWLIASIPNK